MSRISTCFHKLGKESRTALIPFVTAGDPEPAMTVSIMHALVEGGADIIELGVPFSDPMADGPVIQLASERALVHNTSLADVIAMVAEFRKTNDTTTVVLMGYMNPMEAMGYENFANSAGSAGVDGVLLVDLPPEESAQIRPLLESQQIDLIFLIAPNTGKQRIELISRVASGYLYYVSLKGVTGSNQIDVTAVSDKLSMIRKITTLPVGVGFGIRDPETAAAVAQVSDAVIVGSVLVDQIASLVEEPEKISVATSNLLRSMRKQMDLNSH